MENKLQQTQYCNCNATGGTGLICSICHKPVTFDKPQLSAETRSKLYKTRLWKEGGSSFECSDYEGICADMEHFLATALEEQKDYFKWKIGLIRKGERQKALSEVEGWLVDVDTDKVDEVFYQEALIKNSIYAELRAKLAEMKEGK